MRYRFENNSHEGLVVHMGEDDRLHFKGGPHGPHSLSLALSDDDRIAAHAEGYAEARYGVGHFAVHNYVVSAVNEAQSWRPLLKGFERIPSC